MDIAVWTPGCELFRQRLDLALTRAKASESDRKAAVSRVLMENGYPSFEIMHSVPVEEYDKIAKIALRWVWKDTHRWDGQTPSME